MGRGLDMVWGSLRTQQIPPLRCGMEMQKVARGMCAFPPIAKCAMDGAPGSAQDDKFMGKPVSCIPCICRYGLRLWFGAYPSETQIPFGNDKQKWGLPVGVPHAAEAKRRLPSGMTTKMGAAVGIGSAIFRIYPSSACIRGRWVEWPLTRI